jgi:hypothetical protein
MTEAVRGMRGKNVATSPDVAPGAEVPADRLTAGSSELPEISPALESISSASPVTTIKPALDSINRSQLGLLSAMQPTLDIVNRAGTVGLFSQPTLDIVNRAGTASVLSAIRPALDSINQSQLGLFSAIRPALDSINQSQLGLLSAMQPTLDIVNRAGTVGLFSAIRPALDSINQSQLGLLSAMQPTLAKVIKELAVNNRSIYLDSLSPVLDAFLRQARPESSTRVRPQLRRGDREVAVMLTVIAFLVVYVSLAVATKHNPPVARLAAVDGPTPFEAGMAAGALVYWLWMRPDHGRE